MTAALARLRGRLAGALGKAGVVPLAASAGLIFATARLALWHPHLLHRQPGWAAVARPALRASFGHPAWRLFEPYLGLLIVAGILVGWAAVAAAAARFVLVHRREPDPQEEHMESRLPPYPFDPSKEALVIGEQHAQEGEQVEDPRWLVLPFEGLYGNTICLGATGSAKTSSLAYPLTMQLIRIHANDPERKLGGLIMDPKGNYAHFVREQMAAAGRADDFFEVALDGEVYTNVLERPDLNAPALAGHFFDAIKNYQGEGHHDPFWRQEALDLATQAIRTIRLITGREPTIRKIYRVGTSYDSFEPWIKEAQLMAAKPRERVKAGKAEPGDHELIEEAESLAFWANEKLAKLDVKLRTSISATLNGACSMFDVPVVRRTFAPEPEDMKGRREFIGFREALRRGYVVSLRIPGTQYKSVSNVVRTLMKLNFFDAVLERLADLRPGERPRPCFFVADEYDQIVTQPADGEYYARSREACAINVVATQSYAVLVSRFKDQHAARALMANLRNQVWMGMNDTDSLDEASRLCGEVDRERLTHSRGESTDQASWSWMDGRLMGHRGGSNEGLSTTVHRERLFPAGVFARLQKDQAIVRAFDGTRPLPPWVTYLKPYYGDPDESWYAQKPRRAGDVRLAVVKDETPAAG